MKMSYIKNSVLAMAVAFLLLGLTGQCYGALQPGFYGNVRKCLSIVRSNDISGFPRFDLIEVNVEDTVRQAMASFYNKDRSIVAALLRMQFHDCFVRGCDASILLDGTGTEKQAPPNLSVRGYEVIDAIKSIFEKKCPRVVSCADIIVMATRDAVNFSSAGKVQYVVETGRLDGKVSLFDDAIDNLPSPKISVSGSIAAFAKKKLSIPDMVYLLGGHTVGVVQCGFFQDRLYNPNLINNPDLPLDQTLLNQLRSVCPQGGTGSNHVFLDQNKLFNSSMIVDKSFYEQLVKKRGILEIDQRLATNAKTYPVVKQLAEGSVDFFARKFGEAMVKLGRVDVITNDFFEGEIRRSCRAVN